MQGIWTRESARSNHKLHIAEIHNKNGKNILLLPEISNNARDEIKKESDNTNGNIDCNNFIVTHRNDLLAKGFGFC